MAEAKKKVSKDSKAKSNAKKESKVNNKKVTKAKKSKTVASKKNDKKTQKKQSNDVWKVLSFVFLVAIVVLVGGILSVIYPQNTPSEVSNTQTNNQNEVSNPEVYLTILKDSECQNCQAEVFADQLKSNLITNLEYEVVELSSSKGQEMKNILGLELVPAYLFSKEIEEMPNWASELAGAFVPKTYNGENYYMLDPQYVQSKYLIDEIPITENTIVVGDPNAKVTLIEFSDYECPFCAIAEGNPELIEQFRVQSPGYVPPIPKIMEEYVETGKVKFVFMNFPLESIHAKARSAHNAALCANEQGEWKEYNDLLFTKRNDWINSANSKEVYMDFAESLNLDMDPFEDCLNDIPYDSQINEELQIGFSKGVSGTPAFFVGKHFLSGAQDYQTVKNLIDLELNK